MLRAYFDESGTGPRSRLVTMVGLLSSPERWRSLALDWKRVLKRYEVRGEYKADHCARGAGQYATWPERRRNDLRSALGSIINRRVRYAAVVSVLTDAFDTEVRPYLPKGSPFSDPYSWCLRTCLEYIALAPKRGRHQVSCIFDEGHGFQRRAFEHFHAHRHDFPWRADVFPPHLMAARSDRRAPLQAADWLVYETRQDVDLQLLRTRKRHNVYAGMFRRMEIQGGTFGAEQFAEIMRPWRS